MPEPSAKLRTVVLVGHCGPDMYMLKSAVSRIVPGAMIAIADDHDALNKHLTSDSLLLINRVLDGEYANTSGLELIEEIAAGKDRPEMMLISNYAEAQDDAVKAGALRGFGKSQLYAEATAAILREAVSLESGGWTNKA